MHCFDQLYLNRLIFEIRPRHAPEDCYVNETAGCMALYIIYYTALRCSVNALFTTMQ